MKTKISLLGIFILLCLNTFSQSVVHQLNLQGEVNAPMNRYVKLGIEAAHEDSVDLILINMNTYGGAVIDADDIVQNILESKIPVWVFIDKNAGSAGAYISIACDSIFMAPSSVMGASTVINQNVEVMPEKIQSFMKGKMKAAAEANNRDVEIAMKMVGENLNTDSASVLTLTTEGAIEIGYCEGSYETIDALLVSNCEKYSITEYKLPAVEKIMAFFLNPVVKSILLLLIIAGLYFEFQTPGIGFPIITALLALVLYFLPDYLHGFLANWELALFFVGVILIALEVLVIPGFGLAGVSGGLAVLLAFMLSMIKNDVFDFTFVSESALNSSFMLMGISLVGFLIVAFFGTAALIKSKSFTEKVAVASVIDSKGIDILDDVLLGEKGVVLTVLRPSGKVKVGTSIYEAESIHGFIEKDQEIRVIEVRGNILKVKA